MLVQCPSCHTAYRVADSLITTANPTFRCSRCKHIFILALKPQASRAEETAAPPPPPKERELSFTFPDPEREKKDAAEEGRDRAFDFPEPQQTPQIDKQDERGNESFRLRATDEGFPTWEEELPLPRAEEEPSAPAGSARDPSWDMGPASSPGEESYPIPQEERSSSMEATLQVEPDLKEEWLDSTPEIEQSESVSAFDGSPRERAASTVPYLALFGGLLILYSAFTLVHQARPKNVEGLIRNIPWLGARVFRNDHLRHGIVLQSLRPSFQRISGNHEVFVISGAALNRNPVSVRQVKLEGYVYDAEGKEIERQTISVGNAMSPKIIRDLTAQEISILQRLSPQRRFEIPPEESANFVIVFLRPSAEVKSFTCRVVSAETAA